MHYYKIIENNYIKSIGYGNDGVEISKEEYDNILYIIKNIPQSDEVGYKLKEDLSLEEYNLPPKEPAKPTYEELEQALKDLGVDL